MKILKALLGLWFGALFMAAQSQRPSVAIKTIKFKPALSVEAAAKIIVQKLGLEDAVAMQNLKQIAGLLVKLLPTLPHQAVVKLQAELKSIVKEAELLQLDLAAPTSLSNGLQKIEAQEKLELLMARYNNLLQVQPILEFAAIIANVEQRNRAFTGVESELISALVQQLAFNVPLRQALAELNHPKIAIIIKPKK